MAAWRVGRLGRKTAEEDQRDKPRIRKGGRSGMGTSGAKAKGANSLESVH